MLTEVFLQSFLSSTVILREIRTHARPSALFVIIFSLILLFKAT